MQNLSAHRLKVPKEPQGPKSPKSKKLPRKLPEDPVSRAVQIMREATGEKPKTKNPKR